MTAKFSFHHSSSKSKLDDAMFFRSKVCNLKSNHLYAKTVFLNLLGSRSKTHFWVTVPVEKNVKLLYQQYKYFPLKYWRDVVSDSISRQINFSLTKFNNVHLFKEIYFKFWSFKLISSPGMRVSKSRYRDPSRRLRNTALR